MRLFLAVAVLMLAFVAYTEAQDDTMEQRFARFREQVAEIGKTLTEKARSYIDTIQSSDFAASSKSWLQGIKEKFTPSSQ